MGQQEVYDCLNKHRGKWFTSKELASMLKASLGSVTTCLKKLRESSAIKFEFNKVNLKGGKNAYVYSSK